MTEDEAKTKWCPMVRVIQIRTGPERYETLDNRACLNEDGGPKCIGSECMMWRWLYKISNDGSDPERTEHGGCGLVPSP